MSWNAVNTMSDAKFYNDYARYREDDNRVKLVSDSCSYLEQLRAYQLSSILGKYKLF